MILTANLLFDKVNKLDFGPTVHLYLPVDKQNRDYFRRINNILPGAAWQLSVCLVALRFAKLLFLFHRDMEKYESISFIQRRP